MNRRQLSMLILVSLGDVWDVVGHSLEGSVRGNYDL